MIFNVSCKLKYYANEPGAIVLNIHPDGTGLQTVLQEELKVYKQTDEVASYQILYSDVPHATLLNVPFDDIGEFSIAYQGVVDNTIEFVDVNSLHEVPIALLPAAVLRYLNPSRYCQSDKLFRFANHNFSKVGNGFSKVLEICDWIFNNLEYVPGSTGTATSAYETLTELQGVCRDFAHLGIALCRSLNIPARYFTGYSYLLKPQDFHACFEAYLGNKWVVFDPTRLAPLNGLVKIATGADASETAVANMFGNINFMEMEVNCVHPEDNFIPIYYTQSTPWALSYL